MSSLSWLFVISLTSFSFGALAQKPDFSQKTNPPQKIELPHKSIVAGHKNFEDAPIADWKQSNAVVKERGGWRAYLSEAQASSAQGNTDSAKNPHAAHQASAAGEK